MGNQSLLPWRFPSTVNPFRHQGWISQYLPRFGGARVQHLRPQDVPRPSRQGNVKILKRKSNSVEQPAASRGIKSGFRTILRLNWWLVGGRWGGRGASGEGGRREQLGDSNSSLSSKFSGDSNSSLVFHFVNQSQL